MGFFGRSNPQVDMLTKQLDAALGAFGMTIGLAETLHRKGDTHAIENNPRRYFAIVFGMANGISQLSNLNTEQAKLAIQKHVSVYPDGKEVFAEILATSIDKKYFDWQIAGTRAAQEFYRTNDHSGSMLKLAEKFIDG